MGAAEALVGGRIGDVEVGIAKQPRLMSVLDCEYQKSFDTTMGLLFAVGVVVAY